jgi:hypothetical protein
LTLDYEQLDANGNVVRDWGASAPTQAGSYKVIASFAGSADYTGGSASATFTITPATLTVTGITASDKVYDASKTATLNTSSAKLVGVVTNDTVTLSTSDATGTFASQDVGNGITVTISGLTIGGAQVGDYVLTQPATTANITPAAITVTADAESKTVGDADPKLGYTITSGSLVNGDSFSGALTRLAGEDVGAYPITHGTLALNDNYTLTFVGSVFQIVAKTGVEIDQSASAALPGTTETTITAATDDLTATATGTVGTVSVLDYSGNPSQTGSLPRDPDTSTCTSIRPAAARTGSRNSN